MNTAKRRVARTCRAEVIADAPVESVWRVIADVTRTGEWSHEVGGSLGGMGAEEHLAARGEPGDPAALAGRLFRDMTGALELLTMYLGERLGLYQALDADGPATSAELAARTGTVERYVREWLEHHAASGLLVEDEFTAPASIEEQYHYGWSGDQVPALVGVDRDPGRPSAPRPRRRAHRRPAPDRRSRCRRRRRPWATRIPPRPGP